MTQRSTNTVYTAAKDSDGWVEAIWPLLGPQIPFHRRLCQIAEGVKAGLMMSLSVHWTRQVMASGSVEGWLACTAEQWTQESGLSLKEQATVRSRLRAEGLIEERRIGQPARLEHRVMLAVLCHRLSASARGALASTKQEPEAASSPWDWRDPRVMAELLGPPISFHRSLVRACGGVNAALLMSCVLHRMRGQLQRGRTSWMHGEAARWQTDLGLTRREQEAARDQLSRRGIWEERLAGSPARMFMRARLDALAAQLRMPSTSAFERPGRPLPAPSAACTAGLHETVNQGCGVPTSLTCRNRQTCLAESAKLKKGICILGCYRSIPTHLERGGKLSTGVGNSLAFLPALIAPVALSPADRTTALRVVAELEPDTAQLVLDELAGRLSGPRPPRSSIAYLRGLVERARAGSFAPDLALHVAQQRNLRAGCAHPQGLGSKPVGSGLTPCSGTSGDGQPEANTSLTNETDDVLAVQLRRAKSLRQLRELSQRLGAQRSGLAPASTQQSKEQI